MTLSTKRVTYQVDVTSEENVWNIMVTSDLPEHSRCLYMCSYDKHEYTIWDVLNYAASFIDCDLSVNYGQPLPIPKRTE